MSVAKKRLDLMVNENEIKRRLATWAPPAAPRRGYASLYRRHVLQAPYGCDFDFLVGSEGDGDESANTGGGIAKRASERAIAVAPLKWPQPSNHATLSAIKGGSRTYRGAARPRPGIFHL